MESAQSGGDSQSDDSSDAADASHAASQPSKSARAIYIPNSQPLPRLSYGPYTSSPSYGRETILGKTTDDRGNQFYILKVDNGTNVHVEKQVPVQFILKHVSQAALEKWEYEFSKKVKAGERAEQSRVILAPALASLALDTADSRSASSERAAAKRSSRSNIPAPVVGKKRKSTNKTGMTASKRLREISRASSSEAGLDEANGDDDGEEWEVEKIVGNRMTDGLREYEVKWVGWDDTTWEPAKMLEHAGEAVYEYWSNKRDAPS